MRRLGYVFVSGFLAVAANAQQPAAPARELPPLITDVSMHENESPLVAAAKKTVAARLRNAGRASGVVIDNAYLHSTSGHVSEAYSSAPLPTYAGPNGQPSTPPPARTAPREVLQKRDALQREMNRMQNEALEPYGGEIEEDRVQQRVNTIPGQINTIDKTYGTQPATVQPTPVQPSQQNPPKP